jgi:hypothetical protein
MRVGLYGPGDVIGLDSKVISRTDPRLNVWDYEPNFMPMVELAEPDLPWRFTPDVADPNGRLTPWIALIVLKGDEYEGLEERLPEEKNKTGLPIRWLRQVSVSALPDLSNAYMWAHVHVTAGSDLTPPETPDAERPSKMKEEVRRRVSGEVDDHVVARLICPRQLSERTKYTAFIVPTFKAGQVAAGLTSFNAGEDALEPGWRKSDRRPEDPSEIDLPYYYKWEFGTSLRGDFEYLVRLLEPRPLSKLGKRPIDCSSLPYNLPPCPGEAGSANILEFEGALMSPELSPGKWENDTTEVIAFRRELANVLNLPVSSAGAADSRDDAPPVTPPIFGRRHSQQQVVNPSRTNPWMEDVNLDPRQRAAAGFGALVVQKEQEALMASVWDQLGDIDFANDILRSAQLGLESSKGIYKKLGVLSVPDFLWTTAPVFSRILAKEPISSTPKTIAQYLGESPIPSAAFDPAFRRVIRSRGRIRKRQDFPKPTKKARDILSRLNTGEIAAAGPPPNLVGMPSMCAVTEAAIRRLTRETEPQRRARGKFRINGKVVNHVTRREVSGVRVEVWDKDPFFSDLVGSSTTDLRGMFRVEFDRTYYQERPLDPRPDLLFKVFRGERSIAVVSPSVLKNVDAGDTEVVVEIDEPLSVSQPSRTFRISGRVIDRATGNGVGSVRVEAWDKDPLINDLLGSTTTDLCGEFLIEFDKSFFKDWVLDPRPDVFFKVYRGESLLKSTEHEVIWNISAGETSARIELDVPVPPLSPPVSPHSNDFCEEAVTCDAVYKATETAAGDSQLHRESARIICEALGVWLSPPMGPSVPRKPADLQAVYDVVKRAIAPWTTIPARIAMRIKLGAGVHQIDLLGRLESEVEFPQPMYEPLAAISQDLILPGVETVPQNTISILKTNRRFIEDYMLGLNDSLTSEIIWRGAPVYVWTTYFRQFWSVEGLADPEADPELSRDITRIQTWTLSSSLGTHDPRLTDAQATVPPDRAVLLVRGDVLKRYPNTLVYAVETREDGKPALEEFGTPDPVRLWPIFSGSLPPDLTFLGFDITPVALCTGGANGKGYFIVLEERLGEPRFGFDAVDNTDVPDATGDHWWYDMSWAHFDPPVGKDQYIDQRPTRRTPPVPMWGSSSATTANICLQRPVRMAVHASRMLSKAACYPPQ